eukprot:1678990-Lingulodinium_polyedra.AAC.1
MHKETATATAALATDAGRATAVAAKRSGEPQLSQRAQANDHHCYSRTGRDTNLVDAKHRTRPLRKTCYA